MIKRSLAFAASAAASAYVRHALPLACVALALGTPSGCGNDPDGPGNEVTLEQRMQKLGTCTPSDLVPLLPWTGPAFGADGKLLGPLPAGHVEAVVNGWPKRDLEATQLREKHGQIVAEEVFGHAGLLGFQGYDSVECNISMSHTLWKNEASMLAFVTGSAHATAMANATKMHHAFGGAHWSAEARTVAPTWREGIARLVQEYR